MAIFAGKLSGEFEPLNTRPKGRKYGEGRKMKKTYIGTETKLNAEDKKALKIAGCTYRTRRDGVLIVTHPDDVSINRILGI